MGNMLAIDPNDAIVKCLAQGTHARWISSWKELKNQDTSSPVIFRSMSQRKTVAACEQENRDYYYIDTGYLGNLEKRKDWHRIVKNGMQHSNVNFELPSDRFIHLTKHKKYIPFNGWRKTGSNILVVTPSEKPCKFYGINRDKWLEQTVSTLKEFTDRKIIVRDKGLRRERIGANNIYNQFVQDNIYAVVTYNSIAATESIGFGVPCFTLAPNVADPFCLKDLSMIESPLYADVAKVQKWQHWLAYCQYTPEEMQNGTAMKLIRENNLS